MRKTIVAFMITVICGSLIFAGCGAKKEASPGAAIQKSQSMATTQQKADYLIGQAKAFYNSKQYGDAMSIAQYVVSHVDSNSQAAKSLIEKAKDSLAAQAKVAADNMKKQFSGFGK